MAYIQDESNFVFNKVFPTLLVDKKSDDYFIYDKGAFLRDEAQERAPGAESAGGGYNLTTATYDAKVYAWHDDVPDQVIENSDQPLQPMADSTVFVTQKLLLRQENLWMGSFFKTGVWGTDATVGAKWSDFAGSDPVGDVKTGIQTILQNTGFTANRLTLGFPVFNTLTNHPDIVDRIKYGASNGNPAVVTEQALAAIFGVERVVVARGVQATTNEGNASPAYGFIAGNNALLSYAPSAPGIRKPSAGYCYYWKGISGGVGLPVKITDFYLQWRKATRVEGEVAVDMHLVSSDCGYFLPALV